MSVIPGSSSPETLLGTPGDDLITAYQGNDVVYAFGGVDTVYGGAGNDSLTGGTGNDLLFGESGDDTLVSSGDTDQMFGGIGNDLLFVNDINYDGQSTAFGGKGDDTLALFDITGGHADGGDGIDLVLLSTQQQTDLYVDLATQTLDGHGTYAHVSFTSMERLQILATAGNDTILAGDYADRIMAGGGHNLVDARGGDDFVSYVARDANTLEGGAGNDVLSVSSGNSSLYFIVSGSDGRVDDGGLSVITGFESYAAYGGQFADIAAFSGGNDTFRGARGEDTAYGLDGRDILCGQQGYDLLYAGAGRDDVYGGSGNDSLYGGDGSDFLGGGAGADLVFGGAGDDRIRFYQTDDTVTGGDGADVFLFTLPQAGSETVTDFASGTDHLRFTGAYVAADLHSGPLNASQLSLDDPVGSTGQFVQSYDSGSDTTTLRWFPHGSDVNGGVTTYVTFLGHVTLTVDDFQVI